MPNTATRLASSAGAVGARSTTTATAPSANRFKAATDPSKHTQKIAGSTAPACESPNNATPPIQNKQPTDTLTPIIRRARSSNRVRRRTRGHSRANAHRNAGANMNGYT